MAKVVNVITNVEFGQMVNAAEQLLKEHAESINKLNVFPVPDGDTGTNMSMSMASGAQYERDAVETDIDSLAAATSKGLLMGARGNSGVILSQIFRGISNSVKGKQTLNAREFADALKSGAEAAYKAVMKPTEGTILTVIRMAAQAADETAAVSEDATEVAHQAYLAAAEALRQTPEMLPVLKEVGVVDSGGQGLVLVLQAFYDVLNGEVTQTQLETPPDSANFSVMTDEFDAQVSVDPEDIIYTYCTTILLEVGKGSTWTKEWNYDKFYEQLSKLGDSLLALEDDGMVKVHVHVEDPGAVLSVATTYGSIATVKIDNMRDQQQAVIDRNEKTAKQPAPHTAVIAIAVGDGVADLYKSLGATTVIAGGQTMNPSTQDIVDAINQSGAQQAVILPNNSNIFMAADQAVEIADIPSAVVKTRSIQQGLTSLLGLNPEAELDAIVESMTEYAQTVKSGQITQSVRDTTLNGQKIKKGDYMAMVEGDIVGTSARVKTAAEKTVKSMLDVDSEVVTIIYGADRKEADAQKLSEYITQQDPDLEVEIHAGQQPLYDYLISVE